MSGSSDETLFTLRVPENVAKTLFAFARNPVTYVGAIISGYIVRSVLNLGAFGVNSVLSAFGIVAGFFDGIRVTLVRAFGSIGIDLLAAYLSVQQVIGSAVRVAGPGGPFLAIGFTAVTLYLGYRVAVALLGEIPVGSSIVDLLGLR
ncbi:hypothetical protein [Haloarcula marina]|uniref:hypothetical protein n=1 Tax=Haloarcula marina TaxID=2961574 RepID=UPI0020B645B4|nr:hypothetical protein [Halomicroarcula marina]